MSEGSQVSKVTICVKILKWHPVIDSLTKVRYRAARAAKNWGLSHCRFSLSHHLARPREGWVEIYNVKVLRFSLSAGTFLTCPMEKKLLDLNYICPGGMRVGRPLICFWKLISWNTLLSKHDTTMSFVLYQTGHTWTCTIGIVVLQFSLRTTPNAIHIDTSVPNK